MNFFLLKQPSQVVGNTIESFVLAKSYQIFWVTLGGEYISVRARKVRL